MDPLLETASGQQRAWTILEKLGEGDAGEVYRVESMLDRQAAILKRPRQNGFPSDAIRQANQIQKEGQVLGILNRLDQSARLVHLPALLDQSKTGTEFSERYFIVITAAQGFSLSHLARVIRFGTSTQRLPGDPDTHSSIETQLLNKLAETKQIPKLLILRCISGLFDIFESIHSLQADTSTGQVSGVIWNDVKPDHIFWDPIACRFTLIDWGNAQYLEADGVTRDRLSSRFNDYQQFLESMGHFLSDENPELYALLNWPLDETPTRLYTEGILPLRTTIESLLKEELEVLANARLQERELLSSGEYTLEQYERLGEIHSDIVGMGELPDYAEGERYFFQVARNLVVNGDLADAGKLFHHANTATHLQVSGSAILERIAAGVANGEIPYQVLLSGLAGDWKSSFWDLRQVISQKGSASNNEEISDEIRIQALGQDSLRPKIALNRLIYALQSSERNPIDVNQTTMQFQPLKEELLQRWTTVEPDPPNSGIDYRELDPYIELIQSLGSETGQPFLNSLEQPRMLAEAVLDAWGRKDFEAARLGLRQLLLWDPDRARIFLADQALLNVPNWLADISAGPHEDEPLQEFSTRLEIIGREFRNRIGSAVWLDSLLDAFKQLRKGGEPTDILVNHPEAREELAWLVVLEPRRPLLATPGHTLHIERLPLPNVKIPILGIKESRLGTRAGIVLSEPLDTWTAEARGSSARLFLGEMSGTDGEPIQAAMKLMRPDRVEYSLPLFSEEVRILTLMREVPGVIPLLECGFIRLDGPQLPPEDRHATANNLTGEVQRFGPDSVHNFLSDMEKRTEQGWIPYLALEKQELQENLLLLCDTGHTSGRTMPILEGLIVALQICDILEVSHTRNIVYRDHKILHYYWREEYNGVMMIDWNVARRHPEGLSKAEIQFDLVQFGARALHYILTGRPAPGAIPMGPNRPEEIEAAEHSYTAQWTYDDQRLPKDIKELLEAVLTGAYLGARTLHDDIFTIYQKLSELI